jgi:O-antigen biosynthesis protein
MMVQHVPDDLPAVYSKDYFSKETGSLENMNNVGYDDYILNPMATLLGKASFVELFRESAKGGNRILDVGCADGSLLEFLKMKGFDASGLDISEYAAEAARQKGLIVETVHSNRVPFAGEEFDFVSAFDYLQHHQHPKDALQQIHDNLKREGIFFYSTLCVSTRNNSHDYWFSHSLEHLLYYDAETLHRMLEEVFGSNAVLLTQVEVNGVNEIYGIAKKGVVTEHERELFETLIAKQPFKEADKRMLQALVYSQWGLPSDANRIIDTLENAHSDEALLGRFYIQFFQGHFYEALKVMGCMRKPIPLSNSVFWQAHSYILQQVRSLEQSEREERDAAISRMAALLKQERMSLKEAHAVIRRLDMQLQGIQWSRVVRPALYLQRKLRRCRQLLAPFRSYIERHIARLAKRVLSENTRSLICRYLPYRYQVKTHFVPNRKWAGPLVSVILPCYNYGRYVRGALESIFRQTLQDIEIIIIDPASTDAETVNVLRAIEAEHGRVRVIRQPKQSVSESRNVGAEASAGKYLCFFDPDDLMEPTYLEKAVICLERNQHLGCAYSWLQCFGESQSVWQTQDFDPETMRRGNISPSHGVMRKSMWEKVRRNNGCGFLTKYHGYSEDWVFWIDAMLAGFGGKAIRETLIQYRVHADSLSGTHKPGFAEHLTGLYRDRRDFFSGKRSSDLRKKLSLQMKSTDAFVNLADPRKYGDCGKKTIVLFLPWLNCGGLEVVTLAMIRWLQAADYHIVMFLTETFESEWRGRFVCETRDIYQLDRFLDEDQYEAFIMNFLRTREIAFVGGIHSQLFYRVSDKIGKAFPHLRIFDILHNDAEEGYIRSACRCDEWIDRHIVISQRIRNSLRAMSVDEKKVEVVYNAIDTEHFFRTANRTGFKKTVIGFLGRFSPEKCPLAFLEIARRFRDDARVEFRMAGDGALREELERYAEKESLQNVRFYGFADPREFFSETDIVLITSAIEGLPMNMLEAMAMENVVVSTDVGEIRSVIRDGISGFVIQSPTDIDSFVERIQECLDDRGLLKRMGAAARAVIVEQFDAKRAQSEYVELFEGFEKTGTEDAVAAIPAWGLT